MINIDPRIEKGDRNLARLEGVNIGNLGKAYLGGAGVERLPEGVQGPRREIFKGNADMGVQLGNQRVTFPEAVRRERPDGSFEYYDRNDALLGDLEFNNKPLPGQTLATSAEGLNAPIMGETAESFVESNIYENYGAQNFGDEGIVAALGERGGGGGIPQVSISNELGALEDAVARKLGVEKKGIRSIASLQAAADAVIADARAKNRVLFNMQDGKRVFAENPGIGEVMWDLKIPPAQQQAIANALYQLEAGRRQNVDLDA